MHDNIEEEVEPEAKEHGLANPHEIDEGGIAYHTGIGVKEAHANKGKRESAKDEEEVSPKVDIDMMEA